MLRGISVQALTYTSVSLIEKQKYSLAKDRGYVLTEARWKLLLQGKGMWKIWLFIDSSAHYFIFLSQKSYTDVN